MYWADSHRAHEMQAHEVIVIDDYEQLQPSITCKKPRLADEQPSCGKDTRAGATSKKPSDPLFEALRPMCMRHAQPTQTPLQPFTDVLQLQGFMEDPGLILDHLPIAGMSQSWMQAAARQHLLRLPKPWELLIASRRGGVKCKDSL